MNSDSRIKVGRNPPDNQAESGQTQSGDGGNLPVRLRKCAQIVGSGDKLARRSKIPRRTLESYLTGESEPKASRLVAIADAAGVTVEWLASGRGSERVNGHEQAPKVAALGGLAVLGLADCGLRGWFQGQAMSVRTARPGDLHDPDAFAVIALGASMRPHGIRDGFLCFCSPRTAADSGDAVYIERRDGTASIKAYLREDAEWIYLRGWLDPDEAGRQDPYEEHLKRSALVKMAPVIYVKVKL